MDAVNLPETTEVDTRAKEALSLATEITIRDNETYETACAFLKSLKAIEKEIADTFDEPIKRAFEAHKSILGAKGRHMEPIQQAERVVKPKIATYLQEQERIRRDEERRLQEEARKRAEEEALAEAAELEAEGETEAAEQLISEPIRVAPVIVPKMVPKVTGVAMKENWRFRVTDANKIPREYLKIDEIKIGQIVRALKDKTKIPGIEAYPEKLISAGSR